MASIFRFRTRSPSRDLETDRSRFKLLNDHLDRIAADIEAEREGLTKRYQSVSANAAFLSDTMEEDNESAGSVHRLTALTSDMMACENRLTALGRQRDFLRQLREAADSFGSVEQDASRP